MPWAGRGKFRRRAYPNRTTATPPITTCFGNSWPPPVFIICWLMLAVLVIAGIWGTYMVDCDQETSSVLITRLAWVVTLAGTMFEIYANWWCVYLRSMNEVVAASRIYVVVFVVRLALAAGLLCAGAGLLSIPIAAVLSDGLMRWLARSRCLALLKDHPPPPKTEVKKILKILWPNTWRVGVLVFSNYLTVNANTAICLAAFGLAANANTGCLSS